MGPDKANLIEQLAFQANSSALKVAKERVTLNATRAALATIDSMLEILGIHLTTVS